MDDPKRIAANLLQRSEARLRQRSAVLVLFLLSLQGCAAGKIQQEAKLAGEVKEAVIAKCERLYPDKYKKPVSPRIACFNEAERDYADAFQKSTGNNPYYANVQMYLAKRTISAQKYDAGKTTQAEYELEVATAAAEYSKFVSDYRNNQAIVSAAEEQAAAARSLAITASLPKTQTCNTIGNTVTCY